MHISNNIILVFLYIFIQFCTLRTTFLPLSLLCDIGDRASNFFLFLFSQSVEKKKMVKVSIFVVWLMLLHCWIATSEAKYLKYKDPKQPLNVRIKDLMDRMTLEEKIGQMTQIERKVASAEIMKNYYIGKLNFFN